VILYSEVLMSVVYHLVPEIPNLNVLTIIISLTFSKKLFILGPLHEAFA